MTAEALACVRGRHPRVRLVPPRELDPEAYPELAAHSGQIEVRACVPHGQLLVEVSRFDVNLAPLEPDSRFHEARSAVLVVPGAAMADPSIVRGTPPMPEEVRSGETGLIANDPAWWAASLAVVCDDAQTWGRRREAAQRGAFARFGGRAYRSRAVDLFDRLVALGGAPT